MHHYTQGPAAVSVCLFLESVGGVCLYIYHTTFLRQMWKLKQNDIVETSDVYHVLSVLPQKLVIYIHIRLASMRDFIKSLSLKPNERDV